MSAESALKGGRIYHPVSQAPHSKNSEDNHDTPTGRHLYPNPSLWTWGSVIWPLVLHSVLVSTIVAVVLRGVDGHDFNIENRTPTVLLPNGSSRPTAFTFLQSDITTLLSSALAVLRLVAACWLGPLCWRCAFILLNKVGLTHDQLHAIISYGIPAIPLARHKTTCLVVWVVMVVVLPVHAIAPILTGSVTWTPSSRLTERVPNGTIDISTITSNRGWSGWNTFPVTRERIAVHSEKLPT